MTGNIISVFSQHLSRIYSLDSTYCHEGTVRDLTIHDDFCFCSCWLELRGVESHTAEGGISAILAWNSDCPIGGNSTAYKCGRLVVDHRSTVDRHASVATAVSQHTVRVYMRDSIMHAAPCIAWRKDIRSISRPRTNQPIMNLQQRHVLPQANRAVTSLPLPEALSPSRTLLRTRQPV